MTEKEQILLAQTVLGLKQAMPALIEMSTLQAQLARSRYLAFIREGFTPDEALRLCPQGICI